MATEVDRRSAEAPLLQLGRRRPEARRVSEDRPLRVPTLVAYLGLLATTGAVAWLVSASLFLVGVAILTASAAAFAVDAALLFFAPTSRQRVLRDVPLSPDLYAAAAGLALGLAVGAAITWLVA